jgi:DNA-directed RNA polymerase subunit RPC12/RpoP
MSPRQLKVTLTETGRLDDVCPHCGQFLNKRPTRKTACPHCKQFIFVRTRPIDRQSVLVTEEQAKLLQNEWESFQRASISPHLDFQEMEKCRERLAEKFGKWLSDKDVAWAYLNQEAIRHAKQRDWGLYRNMRLSMAAILEKDEKPAEALKYYLEVCYLDLNGPQNTGGIENPELRASLNVQDFTIEDAFLAPAVIDKILEIIIGLKIDENQVCQEFMQVAERNSANLKLPVSPQTAWKKLSAEFYL